MVSQGGRGRSQPHALDVKESVKKRVRALHGAPQIKLVLGNFSLCYSLQALRSGSAQLPALCPEPSKPQPPILCSSLARELKPQFSAIIADSQSVSFLSGCNRKQRVFKAAPVLQVPRHAVHFKFLVNRGRRDQQKIQQTTASCASRREWGLLRKGWEGVNGLLQKNFGTVVRAPHIRRKARTKPHLPQLLPIHHLQVSRSSAHIHTPALESLFLESLPSQSKRAFGNRPTFTSAAYLTWIPSPNTAGKG